MKKRRIFRYIAISLIIAIAVDTIPIYALPIAQEAEEQTELLMPEGVPLPTEPPVLEELENDGGIPEDELLASLPPMDETETCESPILEEAQEKREENTKHFLTADHTYLAAIYPSAVHYQEDGIWKDIDNTLRLQRDSEGDAYYENTASNTHVRFAQSAEDETVVSIEKDGLALSWGLAPADANGVENSSEEAQAEEIVEESTDQADLEFSEETAEMPVSEGTENDKIEDKTETEEASDGSEDEKVAIEENVDNSADEEAVDEAEELPASTFHVIQNPRKARVRAAVQEELPETEEEIQAYNETYTQLPQLTSAGYYPDILPDIDLSYMVTSNTVKEYVTFKSVAAADTPLSFRLSHQGLSLEVTEDGRILAHSVENPEETAFEFSAPYLYDGAGAESYNVHYSLETGEEESILTIVPDQEWLTAPDRVYPVVIDPSTETDKWTGSVQDTFVQSKNPNQSGVAQNGSFYVGVSYPYGVSRGYIRFPNLPTLSKGDMVYYAKMYVWQREFSTEGQTYFNIAAHMVTSDWNPNTVSWNNQPTFDGAALDYFKVEEVASGGTIYVTPKGVDITKAVRSWYTGNNYGIVLKPVNENPTYKELARFFASNYPEGYASGISAEQYPGAYIYYKNAAGLEDYWSYHEQSAGRAGTGYTHDFTGNQVFVHTDSTTSGSHFAVTLSHVYNLSSSDTSSRFGNGWRLNVMQQIFNTGNADYPYKYVDGDGTEHYFYKDTKDGNKLKDEDGLGLTITNTGVESRTIETKDKYKLVFGSDSYLRQEIDPNGNTTTYTYGYHANGNFLAHIGDPTGAGMSFSYSDNLERLTKVHDSAGRITQFAYDAAGNLTKITYPDGSYSTYSYDGKKLIQAKASDGYAVNYEYTDDFRVPRVSKIHETAGSEVGQSLKISYQNGSTTLFEDCGLDGDLATTADNLVTTYNFDNMGRVTDVYDEDGNANSYTYYKENLLNHKLKQSGSTQRTVYNYLTNPNLLPDITDTWYTKVEDLTEGVGVLKVTEDGKGYVDDTSIWVGKAIRGGGVGSAQQVSLPAGTYTFSSYIKTLDIGGDVNSSGASVQVITSSGRHFADRFLIGTTDPTIDNGWERVAVTFHLEQPETVTAWCGIFEGRGNAWFDCLQLEEGTVANRINLMRNSGFEWVSGNQVLQDWTPNAGSQSVWYSSDKRYGTRSGMMMGEAGKLTNMAQGIRVKGKEGDIFSLSGWVKADVLPGRRAGIGAAVIYTNGAVKWVVLDTNPYVSGWQYLHGIVSTDDENASTNLEYKAIHLYLFHEDQLNTAYFDGIQLTRDTGQSYVYDSKGNLTSAASAAEKSGFTYDGNSNLTKISNPDGTSFTYTYDAKKNLTSAKSSEGVTYTYTYDNRGNPLSAQAQGTGSEKMTSSATYTSDGRYVHTVTDARGGVRTNTYDAGNRLLTAETDPLGNTVSYTYQASNDRLTQVSASDGTQTITNTYTYTGDQLTDITHNGFHYLLTYDGYGNTTSTAVGTQVLSSNTYLPHNGLLSYSDYGNGGRVGYTYDKWGRTTEKKYNDQAAFRYVYDAYGNLARTENLINQTTVNYQYDMIGRPVGMNSSDGQSLRISYDSKNRIDYVTSKIGTETTKTKYVYGNTSASQKAGLIYGVEIDESPVVSYAYDNMARRSTRTLDLDTDFVTSYGYLAGKSAGTTTALIERMQNGSETLWYGYDALGNIISVSKGTTKANAVQQEQYVYDGLGQLIRENSKTQNKTFTYTYDAGGNRTEKKEYAYTTGTLGEAVQTLTYSYGDENWKDKLTAIGDEALTYDAIGNPLTWKGMTMTWANGRQLANQEKEGLQISHEYNDSGIRTKKTVNGQATKYYLNGSQILCQETGNERIDFLYDEAGDLLGFKYGGARYYYIRNLQSDITGILNSAGQTIVSYTYDSWGNPLSVTGSAANTIGQKNPFRYRGYYYDQESGLYYLNSRYYDPEVGRFINADGYVATGQSLLSYNMFAYCRNNPVNSVDYTGNSSSALEWWSSTMWWLCGADSVLPFGDALYVGGILVLGAVALSTISSTTVSIPKTTPRIKSKEKTKEKDKAKVVTKSQSQSMPIYRYGKTNPGNLTPKQKDKFTGLSFSTTPPPAGVPAAVTTMGALNSTGKVIAIQDKPTHVCVIPAPHMGTLQNWIDTGSTHPCTEAVRSVVIKWDGGY